MEKPMESFNFTAADIGVGLLESITLGLYREPGDVLREYVSNEIDNEPAPTRVDIRIDPATQTVFINGDGPGMNWTQFRNAVRVGISFKDPGVNIGFRGIGIWAGVAACRELSVATKSDSDAFEYELVVDCDKLRSFFSGPQRNRPLIEVLNACAGYRKRASKRSPGTEVTMNGILPNFQALLDEDAVRAYITKECPVTFETGFKHATAVEKLLRSQLTSYRRVGMNLNGVPVRGLHIPTDAREPIFGKIVASARGRSKRPQVLAYYWMCHGRETARFASGYDSGLRVRVKNFTVVQPPTLQAHIKDRVYKGQNMHMFEYWVGEVHAAHPELKPNAERKDLETSLAADQLMASLADVFTDVMVPFSRTLSDFLRLGDAIKEASQKSTVVRPKEYPDVFAVKSELDDLGAGIEDLRSRNDKLLAKFKELRRKERGRGTSGIAKLVREMETGLEEKTTRAVGHLRARRNRLEVLFEKMKKAEITSGTEPTERAGEAEVASTSQEEEPAAQGETLVGTTGTPPFEPSPELQRLVERAATQMATFETDSSRLAQAFLLALIEMGLAKEAKEVQSVVDSVVRVAQRRR